MQEIIEKLRTRAALAPMAGYSDAAFRMLCMEYGAAYCVTEMVSAKGLAQGNRNAWELLTIAPEETPCALQLFTDEPQSMAQAVGKIQRRWECGELSPAFMIDINCGCPAPKIACSGGGAALMKDVDNAEKICEAAVNATNVPISVKLRLGWDSGNLNAVEFAKRMEQAGASMLTVHGRTRAQMYAPPVDYDEIAKVKRSVSIPVIANGDVIDGASAEYVLKKTACDGVMVGRGALGNPWVFARIAAWLERAEAMPAPSIEERMAVLLRHVRLLCRNNGEDFGMRQARKTAAHYLKGLRGAAELRSRAVRLNSFHELEELVDELTTSTTAA